MSWTDNHCRYEFEIVTTSPHGPTIKHMWLQLLRRPVGPIHHRRNTKFILHINGLEILSIQCNENHWPFPFESSATCLLVRNPHHFRYAKSMLPDESPISRDARDAGERRSSKLM